MTQEKNLTPLRVALVGNPNCGKTALFNALTGSRQKVANYPGVTVERKEGSFTTPRGRTVNLLDLPGTYSLRARSPDEEVTRDVILGRFAKEQAPELLLCVADATHLDLALRLVLELKRVGRPVALVLNMFDIATRRGFSIECAKLSGLLGVPVVTSVAVRREGLASVLGLLDEGAFEAAKDSVWTPPDRAAIVALQKEADALLAATVTSPLKPDTLTSCVDSVLLHPVAGLVILLAVLFLMFQAVFTWAKVPVELIQESFAYLSVQTGGMLSEGLLRSFVQDGLIGGVGAVVVFLPQILILFFFILLLEDTGYMARAAFLMDKIMGGAGLHGRAFIPLLSGFACAIPAIMACRVIDSWRDRLTTVLVAPLMTCSARIPVYTLIIAAFVPAREVAGGFQLQGLVMFGLYAMGILSALMVAFVMKRLVWRHVPPDPFMLELPDYKWPSTRNLLMGLWHRASVFMRRAGTIILGIMIVIWVLASVPGAPEGATEPAINYSFAAKIGKFIEPALVPVGFNWQISVALVSGVAAREVAVAVLGTVYAVGEQGDNAADVGVQLAQHWSLATALAFLAWYIFAPQCMATLATVRRETNSWRWTAFLFVYMIALAYGAAFVTYRIAGMFGAG